MTVYSDSEYNATMKKNVNVPCRIPECEKLSFRLGLCVTHYNRRRRYGSPFAVPTKRKKREVHVDIQRYCPWPGCGCPLVGRGLCEVHAPIWELEHGLPQKAPVNDRFDSKTFQTDGCWYWTGALSFGYGTFRYNGVPQLSHRVAWQIENGPIPDGLYIDHYVCHNPQCVRVLHLRLATEQENSNNRKGANPDNKSGYRGVSWSAVAKKWHGRFTLEYHAYHVGYFDDPAVAYAEVEKARMIKMKEMGLR